MTYTLFLAPSLQTTQHILGEKKINQRSGPITGTDIRLRASLHGSLRRPFDNVSDLSRPLLRYISYLCQDLHPKTRTLLLIVMHVGATHRPYDE